MLKIENAEVVGWEHAIRGMRNPLNSWEKSDSGYCENYITQEANCGFCDDKCTRGFYIGENDLSLMTRLRNTGTDHRKFMRMLTVYVDITAPLYWWKEFDTYKVGTVANSCSTMHKIHSKEFTLDDFSHEHLMPGALSVLEEVVGFLNFSRRWYQDNKHKDWWWNMIQLLPTSYNQKRTVMLNYEVLANIYKSRKDHKLDEWHTLCDWIKELPYSDLIVSDGR